MKDTPNLVQVGGVYIEPEWETEESAFGDDLDFANISISVVFDETLGRFAVEAVVVERVGDGSEITGAILRDIRVQDRMQKNALTHIWVEHPVRFASLALTHEGKRLFPAFAVLESFDPIVGRTTDVHAAAAARIHEIATIAYMPALQTIGRSLATSQSTAKRLVARARDLGLLADGDD